MYHLLQRYKSLHSARPTILNRIEISSVLSEIQVHGDGNIPRSYVRSFSDPRAKSHISRIPMVEVVISKYHIHYCFDFRT
jgi:hypothetical protein